MFKNNLTENVYRNRLLDENYAIEALKRLGSKIGMSLTGDHLSDNSGHSVRVKDGYFHLFKNDKHTGVSWPEDGGFIDRVKGWFSSNK